MKKGCDGPTRSSVAAATCPESLNPAGMANEASWPVNRVFRFRLSTGRPEEHD